MKHILIVEDDTILNETLSFNLQQKGYIIQSAQNQKEALIKLKSILFDAVLLDVSLPDGNGFSICRNIRQTINLNTAIIFLTADDIEQDILKGYNLGADDYITKPFSILVLEKKLNAILNRIGLHEPTKTYSDHRLQLNFSSYTAHIENKLVEFTPLEFQLLELLIQNKGHIVTRQRILDVIWDKRGNYVDESSLNSMICRIRNRIDTKEFHYIKTIYGTGYMWMNQ